MSKKKKHEVLHFLRYVEEGLLQLMVTADGGVTDEGLRIIKRIYRKLRVLILRIELVMLDRRKERKRITPKQAREEKAKVKKRWL